MPQQSLILNKFEGGQISAKDGRDLEPNEWIMLEGVNLHKIGDANVCFTLSDSTPWQAATANTHDLNSFGRGFAVFYDDIHPQTGSAGSWEIFTYSNQADITMMVVNTVSGAFTEYTGWIHAQVGVGAAGDYDIGKFETLFLITNVSHSTDGRSHFHQPVRERTFYGTSVQSMNVGVDK